MIKKAKKQEALNEVKHIYFFRPSLKTHVDLYLSWTDLLRDHCSSTVITFLDHKSYIEQVKLVERYKKLGIEIIKLPKFFHDFAIFIYAIFNCFKYKKVIVHLKKRKSIFLWFLKRVTGRLKIFTDYEGDPLNEKEYLETNPSPNNSYHKEINTLEKEIIYQKKFIHKFDGVHVSSPEMYQNYEERFKQRNLECIPTGFNESNFYPNEDLRRKIRKNLNISSHEKVFIYSGNLFYSWQNLDETCKFFSDIQDMHHSKLLILTRLEDFTIAEHFCKKYKIDKNKLIIKNVENNEVNSHLNAADFGILLRKNHPMNKLCSPGKVGEYLCSGLKIIFTRNVGLYSKLLKDENFCFFLDGTNEKSFDDFFAKEIPRHEIRDWCLRNVSNNNFKEALLRSIKNA